MMQSTHSSGIALLQLEADESQPDFYHENTARKEGEKRQLIDVFDYNQTSFDM